MIRGVEEWVDQKMINRIVQVRVIDKVCMDCGKRLKDSHGYCKNNKCGHVHTRVKYSIEDEQKALILQEALKRNKHANRKSRHGGR